MPDTIQETLTCPLCLGLLKYARETNCKHVFCNDCLVGHLEKSQGKNLVCPSCRGSILHIGKPNYAFEQVLEIIHPKEKWGPVPSHDLSTNKTLLEHLKTAKINVLAVSLIDKLGMNATCELIKTLEVKLNEKQIEEGGIKKIKTGDDDAGE